MGEAGNCCGCGPEPESGPVRCPTAPCPITFHFGLLQLLHPPTSLFLPYCQEQRGSGWGEFPPRHRAHGKSALTGQTAVLTLLYGPAMAELPHAVLQEGTEPKHHPAAKKEGRGVVGSQRRQADAVGSCVGGPGASGRGKEWRAKGKGSPDLLPVTIFPYCSNGKVKKSR